MSIVITHPEQGIYVGSAMGLGFWSLWDAAGQVEAVTFPDESTARDYVRGWQNLNDPETYGYAEVTTAGAGFATVEELKEAGLEELLGELQITVPTHGNA